MGGMDDTTIARLLRYFAHGHLPPHLSAASAPFGDAAQVIASKDRGATVRALEGLTRHVSQWSGGEVLAALDKFRQIDNAVRFASEPDWARMLRLLLEAKDCAVRAAVDAQPAREPMPSEPSPDGTRWVWVWSADREERRAQGWRWWAIDQGVADIVEALQGRLPTKQSCHGHREHDIAHVWLEDGRFLAVLPDMDALQDLVALRVLLAHGEALAAAKAYTRGWEDGARETFGFQQATAGRTDAQDPRAHAAAIGERLARAGIPETDTTVAAFLEGVAWRMAHEAPTFKVAPDVYDEIENAHVEALRGEHNAPPPVITSRKVTGGEMPDGLEY